MITQLQKNKDSDLARRIFLYYQDKMLAYLSVGSDRYMEWYKDSCLLYYLSKAIHSIVRDSDGVLWIGNKSVEDETFLKTMSLIKEYMNYDLQRSINYNDLASDELVSDILPPPSAPSIMFYGEEWVSYTVEVPQDDVTTVDMPFNIADADIDSLRITLNDGDPIHVAPAEEEGCHFNGTTLYWHTYYNLKAGDKIFIQFLKVSNNGTQTD